MTMFRWIAGGSILVALLPLFSLLLATGLSACLDCPIDEGAAHRCQSWIGDIGGLLHTLQIGGWIMLLTLPYAGGMALAWGIVEVVRAARGKHREPG